MSPSHEEPGPAGSARTLSDRIASMYSHATLDLVNHLALAISNDFVQRPRHYRDVSEEVAEILSEFRTGMGSTPNMPSGQDRAAVYGAVFGRAEFRTGTAGLREAAFQLSSGEDSRHESALRLQLVDRVRSLQQYLSSLDGQALTTGDRRTSAVFGRAVVVLKSPEVAAVFGLAPAPAGAWPMEGDVDGDASYLVAEITRSLLPAFLTTVKLEPLKFTTLQQMAHFGAQTLATVLDDSQDWDDESRVDGLLQHIHRWAGAANSLSVDTLRAWKDPIYRHSLTETERALVQDSPAGGLQSKIGWPSPIPGGPPVFGGATVTAAPDEICCSAPTLEPGCQTVTSAGKICCNSGQQCDSTPVTFTCLPCEWY